MDMLTITDVAERVGVKRQTIDAYRLRGLMPEPDGYLGKSPWWRAKTIDRWNATRNQLGRPRHDRARRES